jgi:hypothetical protein
LTAIREVPSPGEVIDGFLAVRDDLERVVDSRNAHHSPHENDVVFIVFNQQNGM